jgi:hypothetical protein
LDLFILGFVPLILDLFILGFVPLWLLGMPATANQWVVRVGFRKIFIYFFIYQFIYLLGQFPK